MSEGGLCKHQLLRPELCRGGRGSERGFGTSRSGGGGKKEKKSNDTWASSPREKKEDGSNAHKSTRTNIKTAKKSSRMGRL